VTPPPERLDVASMPAALVAPVVTWASSAVAPAVRAELGLEPVRPGQLPAGTRTLVVCGGGTLIDRAKATAKRRPEPVRVVAVPTLWGAGAEASPVIVLNGADGAKEIAVDETFVPDVRVVWLGPSSAAPERLRRAGAGDVWAHTLEALISPLADTSVREGAAELVHALLPLTPDGEHAVLWLDLSARACALQARAGVGLAHGIAHQLEGPLGIGHARLVAAALPTVFALAIAEAPRWPDVAAAYGLDAERIVARLESLLDLDDLAAVRAAVPEHRRAILRDPLTRTNGFLVRGAHLDAFVGSAL
jgi:alcohol dehydrogenase class IV